MVLSRVKAAAAAAAGWNRAACVSESSHLPSPILFCRQECSQAWTPTHILTLTLLCAWFFHPTPIFHHKIDCYCLPCNCSSTAFLPTASTTWCEKHSMYINVWLLMEYCQLSPCSATNHAGKIAASTGLLSSFFGQNVNIHKCPSRPFKCQKMCW